MFETLTPKAPDAIIALMEQAKADPNPLKIDLGVGVYKAKDGSTPIMKAVKTAEGLWHAEEATKTYVSTIGNANFRRDMLGLILGDDHPAIVENRIGSAQATGGSGALRLAAELIKAANPDATVWVSTPTWANHVPLISSNGLKMDNYPYYNRETLGVDFDDMLTHLRTHAKSGDVVLLHGCCHNPTGADLSESEWDKIAELMKEKNLTPFIDLAYFGLGRGMAEDTYGLRKVIEICGEVIMAASCSKNFALYRERVGLVAVITKNQESAKIAQSQFGAIQRKVVSMPPNFGAALVTRILSDEALRKVWSDELTEMRERIRRLRKELATELNVQGGDVLARAIENQNGMFSMVPVTPEQAQALRDEHSVYILNSGRMNMAAANSDNIPRLAKCLLDVM